MVKLAQQAADITAAAAQAAKSGGKAAREELAKQDRVDALSANMTATDSAAISHLSSNNNSSSNNDSRPVSLSRRESIPGQVIDETVYRLAPDLASVCNLLIDQHL